MKKLALSTIILLGSLITGSVSYGQEKQVKGTVFNKITHEPVQSVKVLEVKDGNVSFTDSTGFFSVISESKSREFIFSHIDYDTLLFKYPRGYPKKKLKIGMTPVNLYEHDTIWIKHKNAVSFSPLELAAGAVAFRYERFLKLKQSVGIHTSFYLYGYMNFIVASGYHDVAFKGLKAAPFYRYYPIRKVSYGFFVEGKIPVGYFDFSQLIYGYRNTGALNFPQTFWTAGVGAAIGWLFRLGKTNHGMANLSLGLQYFPLNIPKTRQGIINGEKVSLGQNNEWWYVTGPGAVFEFKFTIGGIF